LTGLLPMVHLHGRKHDFSNYSMIKSFLLSATLQEGLKLIRATSTHLRLSIRNTLASQIKTRTRHMVTNCFISNYLFLFRSSLGIPTSLRATPTFTINATTYGVVYRCQTAVILTLGVGAAQCWLGIYLQVGDLRIQYMSQAGIWYSFKFQVP
jgi:hypothetical protein